LVTVRVDPERQRTIMAAQACAVADDRRTIPVVGNSAVHVGHGLLMQIAAELTPKNGIKASKFVIVSDVNVWALYGQQLVDSFLALGSFKLAEPGGADAPTEVGDEVKLLLTFQVPAGEGSKSRKVKAEIMEPEAESEPEPEPEP
jgi:3-dehydroquinate synthetase